MHFSYARRFFLAALPSAAEPLDDAAKAYGRGDYAAAMELFLPLANRGNAVAQSILGVMYAKGQGVPQDYVLAHMSLNLAASRAKDGDADKRRADRDIVATKMTPAQLAEAHKLAREWKPKTQ